MLRELLIVKDLASYQLGKSSPQQVNENLNSALVHLEGRVRDAIIVLPTSILVAEEREMPS